jgi:cytochrome c-type biogenesis protein CcmH/NrfG
VELAPGDGDARGNLANALFERREFERMEQQAREAVRLKPRDAVAHDLLGLALANQGHGAAAASSFEQAVALDPGNAEARAHLAEARRLLGRRPPG